MAMDLNREMEEMFAETSMGLDPKPAKKTKKKQNKQVQFFDAQADKKNQIGMIHPETMLQNQIQAAQLAETLITEIKQTDSAHE